MLDLHCPWLKFEPNERLYFVGPESKRMERAMEHLDLLASSGAALAAVCLVSGFFTFAAAALTVRLVQRIQKGGRREGTDL